tara:strand:- start:5871 stop:6314 length:444 start_codon:yes stop_codon:yes gene_type:complete
MNKKSKVTNVQQNGTWEGNYGIMYKFEVAFENGDAGEYSSKSQDQNKFVVGNETDYEYIDGKFPKVKPLWINPQQVQTKTAPTQNKPQANNDVQDMIVKQSSLKAAVEFCDKNCTIEDVIDNAEIFYKWVMTGEKPTAKPSNNDMPF